LDEIIRVSLDTQKIKRYNLSNVESLSDASPKILRTQTLGDQTPKIEANFLNRQDFTKATADNPYQPDESIFKPDPDSFNQTKRSCEESQLNQTKDL
jgi:hypothetical protein